jgi:hypothetical protein
MSIYCTPDIQLNASNIHGIKTLSWSCDNSLLLNLTCLRRLPSATQPPCHLVTLLPIPTPLMPNSMRERSHAVDDPLGPGWHLWWCYQGRSGRSREGTPSRADLERTAPLLATLPSHQVEMVPTPSTTHTIDDPSPRASNGSLVPIVLDPSPTTTGATLSSLSSSTSYPTLSSPLHCPDSTWTPLPYRGCWSRSPLSWQSLPTPTTTQHVAPRSPLLGRPLAEDPK